MKWTVPNSNVDSNANTSANTTANTSTNIALPSPSPSRTPIAIDVPPNTPLPTPTTTSIPASTPMPQKISTPTIRPAPDVVPSPVVGSTPSPTPRVTDNWESLRNSLEAELRTGGRLAFEPPGSMIQGSTSTVIARISPEEVGEVLTSGLHDRPVDVSEIKVAPVMKVVLFSDDGAFSITSNSSEEQIIGTPYSQWEWYVQALKSGQHALHLKVIATINTPDRGEKPMDITVSDKSISVDVSYRYMLGSFVSDSANWKYFIGSTSLLTILGIAAGWLRTKFNKQKASSWETLDED